MRKIVATTTFQYFHRICRIRKRLLVSEKNKKGTKNRCGPDFLPFSQNLLNSEAPLVSETNQKVTKNSKVKIVVAAPIFAISQNLLNSEAPSAGKWEKQRSNGKS